MTAREYTEVKLYVLTLCENQNIEYADDLEGFRILLKHIVDDACDDFIKDQEDLKE